MKIEVQRANAAEQSRSTVREQGIAPSQLVSVRLHSSTTLVKSGSREVASGLLSLYPTATLTSVAEAVGVEPRFEVLEERRDDTASYVLKVAGEDEYRFASEIEALAYLEYLINVVAAQDITDSVLLHAGAVALGTGGIVFPGVSGAGKSTLIAALCLSGFDYLTDDIAVVGLEDVALRPYPKAICLKKGGWRAITTAFGPSVSSLEALRPGPEPVFYVRPTRYCSSASLLRVRHVILPARRETGGARPVPISRARALVELARHSLNLPKHNREGFGAIARLVEGAECHTLEYSDLRAAVSAIRSLACDESESSEGRG